MDRKELGMTFKKSIILSWVLFLNIIILYGCETAKGAVYGVGTTAKGVGEGVGVTIGATACGAAKDAVNLWQGILKTDDWIKKNLW